VLAAGRKTEFQAHSFAVVVSSGSRSLSFFPIPFLGTRQRVIAKHSAGVPRQKVDRNQLVLTLVVDYDLEVMIRDVVLWKVDVFDIFCGIRPGW